MSRSAKFGAVAGLGRQAFEFDRGEAGAALCVFFQDYYLQISVLRTEAAGLGAAAAERLARVALRRLDEPPAAPHVAQAQQGR